MVDDFGPTIGLNFASGGTVADVLSHFRGHKTAEDLSPRGLLGLLVPVVPPGQDGDGGQLDPLPLGLVPPLSREGFGRADVRRLVQADQPRQPPGGAGAELHDPPLDPHGALNHGVTTGLFFDTIAVPWYR